MALHDSEFLNAHCDSAKLLSTLFLESTSAGKMTMTEISLKLKTKDKNLELKNGLTAASKVAELVEKVSEATHIPAHYLKILSGYPRKQLNLYEFETIDALGIKCGDTLLVEEDKDAIHIPSAPQVSLVKSAVPSIPSSMTSRSHISDDAERADVKGILLKKEVPSDNSCLFSSIEFVLSGELNTSGCSYMRQLVASAIQSQSEEYNDAVLGKPLNEYCKWIQDPNSWGGAIEIAILSNHFGFEIVVVNSTTGNISRFGEDKKYDQRVFLLFDGIHYDPLYMDFFDLNKVQTMFSTNDEEVLRDAEQLAREAKDSRQFTDVNQFMICCKVCNSIFVGQSEAQNHAKETGHTSFDEVTG